MSNDYGARAAAVIRGEMARRQINQAEMGARIGKDQTWVSRRLNGRIALKVDDLALFATALNLPLTALIEAASEPIPA